MPKKKRQNPKFSPTISAFLGMVDQVQSDYTWNSEEIERLDRLTQDYLHILELDSPDYKERARIATKLQQCRQDRRASKNTVEILEPLVSYLDTDNGKKAINLMKEVLGRTRKAETKMEHRVYRFRVLDRDNIQ